MIRPAPLAIAAVIAFALLQVLTPALSSLGLGHPIGAQSQAANTLVTPAGWAFAIWGPLYVGAFAFAVYQALPAGYASALADRLRWPAAGAFAGNAAWAGYVQVAGVTAVSVLVIGWTLLCLLTAYRRLSDWAAPYTTGERWCAVPPLSALAAWLTVATTVNIAAALRFHGVEAGDAAPVLAAAVVLTAAAIGALALARGRGNPPYALVLLWALAAIHAAGGSKAVPVAIAAILAALVVVAGASIGRRANRGRWLPTGPM